MEQPIHEMDDRRKLLIMAKQQKSVFALRHTTTKPLDQSAAKIVDTAKEMALWYLVRFHCNRKEYLHNSSFCTS